MKILTLSLWLACIGMVHAQLNAKTDKCCFGTPVESSTASQISANLPTGIWKGHNQCGQTVSLHFFEEGLVQWLIQRKGEKMHSRLFNWKCLPDHQADAMLVLTDRQSGQPLFFSVEGNCNALAIQGADCKLQLEYKKAASTAELQRTKQLLTGNWENTTYPFDFDPKDKAALQEAYLTYRFLPNGRFERKIGNRDRQVEERGRWLLAKDGKHVVLSFDDGKATVAQLKYVRVDELVIHHLLSCQDETFNTVEKDFFFNRY
jgi:hypothetical protein